MSDATDRETRIRDLRWQLFNARQDLEGEVDIAKRADDRGDSSRATSAYEGASIDRRIIQRIEAELADLERGAVAPASTRP